MCKGTNKRVKCKIKQTLFCTFPIRVGRVSCAGSFSFVGIFLRGMEAGTCLAFVQVVVSQNNDVRVSLPQSAEQLSQGVFLCRCACVSRFAIFAQTTLVADADGVPVVVGTVRTDGLFLAPCLYRSVT